MPAHFRIEGLEKRALLSQTPLLDINPHVAGSNPHEFVRLGSDAYFVADDGTHGEELWRSDGTAAGTTLFKDIVPGAGDADIQGLTAFNGKLFFFARDSNYVPTLWISDGTAAGTQSLGIKFDNPPGLPRAVGNYVYFLSESILYRTDGTADGTIQLGAADSILGASGIGNGLYFIHTDHVWKTDGTIHGTTDLTAAHPELASPRDTVVSGGALYFLTNNQGSQNPAVLWKMDSLTQSIQQIATLPPDSGSWASVGSLFVAGDRIYFQQYKADNAQRLLWTSDGTTDGTYSIFSGTDIPGYAVGMPDGRLLFTTDGRSTDQIVRLWTTDGTVAGTQVLRQGTDLSSFSDGVNAVVGNSIYFYLGGGFQRAVWKSDGTPQGTGPLLEQLSSEGDNMVALDGKFFFSSGDDTHQNNLWVSDGTADGTQQIIINPASKTQDSSPTSFGSVNGHVLFIATEDTSVIRMWTTDGTAQGTQLLLNDLPGINGGPELVQSAAGDSYIVFNRGEDLWATDGTPLGTVKIHAFTSVQGGFMAFNGHMYFTADNQLWTTDGTAQGTHAVSTDVSGVTTAKTIWKNALYFIAEDGLYRVTQTGSLELAAAQSFGNSAINFAQSGDYLYWVNSVQLSYFNGTTIGMISYPVPFKMYLPWGLYQIGAKVYFRASDRTTGSTKWVSRTWTLNGTTPSIVADFYSLTIPSSTNVYGVNYVIHDGNLYAGDSVTLLKAGVSTLPVAGPDGALFTSNSELWITDGTSQGTRKFEYAGTTSGLLGFVGDKIITAQNSDAYGIEPFVDTATAQDITPQDLPSSPPPPASPPPASPPPPPAVVASLAIPFATVSNHLLSVTGTTGNDRITIRHKVGDASVLQVVRNGKIENFTFSDVKKITLNASNGNDFIDLRDIAIGATLFGGNGNDSIYGSDGADSINGNRGDDLLCGMAGNDSITGGIGHDIIRGGDGTDRLFALAGVDDLKSNKGDTIIKDVVG